MLIQTFFDLININLFKDRCSFIRTRVPPCIGAVLELNLMKLNPLEMDLQELESDLLKLDPPEKDPLEMELDPFLFIAAASSP